MYDSNMRILLREAIPAPDLQALDSSASEASAKLCDKLQRCQTIKIKDGFAASCVYLLLTGLGVL